MHVVETAELGERGADERTDLLVDADVELHGHRAAAGPAHLRSDRLGVVAVQITDDDRGALRRHPPGGRGTDARSAACHHRHLAGQAPHVSPHRA